MGRGRPGDLALWPLVPLPTPGLSDRGLHPGPFAHRVPTAQVSHLWAPEDPAGMCPSGPFRLLTPVFSLGSPLTRLRLSVCLSVSPP